MAVEFMQKFTVLDRNHLGAWFHSAMQVCGDMVRAEFLNPMACRRCGWEGPYAAIVQAGLNHELCPKCEEPVHPVEGYLAAANQAPASPAVVERAPLEKLIAKWQERAATYKRACREANHRGDQNLDAYWDGKYMAMTDDISELSALLLAWPSSRERDEGK